MKILVVGGAGYIGSHMVKVLAGKGHDVVTFDNLSKGYRDAVLHGEFIQGDLANQQQLDTLLSGAKFDAVMHFASFIEVGESVREPAKYYQNNLTNTQNLLDAMVKHHVLKFVFSSTAAVFGEPEYTPIDERHPTNPINPYGRSKLMVEQILDDYDHAYGLKSVALRYFNAAGADPDGELGERHSPETHLIPLVLQAASGRRESISVYGDDYDTPDGTCVRDYIHINDLCDAHLLALNKIQNEGQSLRYNLGNGLGFSVMQVINMAKEVTGAAIQVISNERRQGDPAILVANAALAKEELSWQPQFAELHHIIEHAWQWEKSFFS
ncbi:MAG: UDP-glucose 4-epimerase GalE [Gammaproteobacteria bacterium]|nr:UDP-glucose 4-epimerase GalE [Gammaproteobacteria bacterium]